MLYFYVICIIKNKRSISILPEKQCINFYPDPEGYFQWSGSHTVKSDLKSDGTKLYAI